MQMLSFKYGSQTQSVIEVHSYVSFVITLLPVDMEIRIFCPWRLTFLHFYKAKVLHKLCVCSDIFTVTFHIGIFQLLKGV